MFRQGDLEKQRGYAVSPLMDRTKTGITKSQTGVSAWGWLGWCSLLDPFSGFIYGEEAPREEGGYAAGMEVATGSFRFMMHVEHA